MTATSSQEGRRLRVVILAQNSVLPLDNGARIRNFQIFRDVAERHDVHLLLDQVPHRDDLDELARHGLRPTPLPKPRSRVHAYVAYLGSLLNGAPFDLAVQANPSIRRWLRSNAAGIDVVLTASIGPTLNVPAGLGAPLAIDTHNIEWRRRESELSIRRGRSRLVHRLGTLGMRRFELSAMRRSRRVYVCSDREADELRNAGVGNAVVIPNGVTTTEQPPLPDPTGPLTVAFTGDLGYAPNTSAANWLATEIAPVLMGRTGCRVVIAGRGAPDSLRRAARAAGVDLRSPVPDMRDVLAETHVVLVPLLSGGGTRLKILEAFAAGRPVVTTSLGVEGIDAENGRDVVIADTAEELVTAAGVLLNDPERRRAVGAAARRLVEREYDWRAIGPRLAADLATLTARSRG
ncbi:MAG: glycosyltransferase family 4 protein [Thermoleophilia bacterium]